MIHLGGVTKSPYRRLRDASLIYTGIDKHTGEDVGLYSMVISRADYDAMAGQIAASMEAAPQRDEDVPDRPLFTNVSDEDDDEDADVPEPPKKTARAKAPVVTARAPIVQHAGPAIGATYRPSCIPPSSAPTPIAKKPAITVDTSKIHAGTIVSHKAFGKGQVKGIDGAIIVVTFDGRDKRFQFPAGLRAVF